MAAKPRLALRAGKNIVSNLYTFDGTEPILAIGRESIVIQTKGCYEYGKAARKEDSRYGKEASLEGKIRLNVNGFGYDDCSLKSM